LFSSKRGGREVTYVCFSPRRRAFFRDDATEKKGRSFGGGYEKCFLERALVGEALLAAEKRAPSSRKESQGAGKEENGFELFEEKKRELFLVKGRGRQRKEKRGKKKGLCYV